MAIVLDGTTGITTPDLTDTSLTSGRVVYAGTGGNLTGSSTFVFDGSNLGLGVTPSTAWATASATPAIQFGARGSLVYYSGVVDLCINDAAGTYLVTGPLPARYRQQSGYHIFSSAPAGTANANISYTDVFQVAQDRSIALQGATVKTGTGITFPATQSASSDANTLDDYEEGTWTPQPTFGGGTTGMTFSVQSGSYTKIGRSVFISARITFTNKGSATGGFFISSLPFATASGNAFYSGASIGYVDGVANASTWTVQQTIILDAGQTYMLFRYINGSGTSTNHTNSDVGNSLDIIVTATYQSA